VVQIAASIWNNRQSALPLHSDTGILYDSVLIKENYIRTKSYPNMKKLFTAILLCAAMTAAQAAPNVFNHLGIGAAVGTHGVSVELATPITGFVNLRAGVSYMPGITFNANADYAYSVASVSRTGSVSLKGDLGRVQGQVIFNVYPVPKVPFYVAAGAYFGGSELLKITGQAPELSAIVAQNGGAVIGDYKIPVDPQGNISGGLKVKSFRPYVGIGWGRAIPGKIVNFAIDLGVQFQGKPKLYTDYDEIDDAAVEDDNTFNKIADALKVYPTLALKLNFRAF